MITIGGGIVAIFSIVTLRWAADYAAADADRTAAQMARNQAGLLVSELQKFRLLPIVLTDLAVQLHVHLVEVPYVDGPSLQGVRQRF
jgi:hypothetical protein